MRAVQRGCVKLKTPWRYGTTHIDMSLLEFMQRLSALVPRARLYMTASMGGWHPMPRCALVVPKGVEQGGRRVGDHRN